MKSTFPKKYYDYIKSHPKKYLGQTFLIDKNILNKIGEISELDPKDTVLEIGPGFGVLTSFIDSRVKKVISIEKDKDLYDYLLQNNESDNISFINADFLNLDIQHLKIRDKLKIISNLPYNVASQIIIKFLESSLKIEKAVIMIQKEMGERICSGPNSKIYGSISILVQSYMNAYIRHRVSPNSFWPKPKIDSVIVELTPIKKHPVLKKERKLFNEVVRKSFHARRKKMINNLKKLVEIEKLKEIFENLGLDENSRAEMLSVNDFAKLSRKILNYPD